MYTIMLSVFDAQGSSSRLNPLKGIAYEYDEEFALWYPVLDQGEVILRLLETFDDVMIGTQDVVLERAQVLERFLMAHGASADNVIIASEYHRVKNVGPVHPFSLGAVGNGKVHGYVRRFDIKFCSEHGFSVEMQAKIRHFLKGFALGEIEEYGAPEISGR